MGRKIKTPARDIVTYWAQREDECGLGVDWAEALERCWRCGYEARLERCHIVPHSLGGLDEPANLVLLCYRCHREAPNHCNPEYMWIWLRKNHRPFYDTYWTHRGLEEYEKLFDRKLFEGVDPEAGSAELAQTVLKEEMARATIHYGQAHLNPVTMACVMREAELRLLAMIE